MKTPNFGPYHIRKWFLQMDDTLATEAGAPADGEPLRRIVIAAALHNPYAGRFEADLSAFIEPSPMLGEEFGRASRPPRRAAPSRATARPAWWASTANTSTATRC